MRQPRSLRQYIRERDSLFRAHIHIGEMDALQIGKLADIPPQQGDEATVLVAEIAIVAQINEAEGW